MSSPTSSMTTSASTLRAYHFPEPVSIPEASLSGPSSPHSRSSMDNSLPDSPLSGSISSLPSVSSSFFFSSAAASPPHSHSSQLDQSASQGLIIPSLTLPTALRRSTPYGQTLGSLRVLVLVRRGADTSLIQALVLDGNEDIVDAGSWEETVYGRTIKASTDWAEHNDPRGPERFEPLRNVEFTEFPPYESEADVNELIHNVISCVQEPFQSVSEVLHPKHRPSSTLSNLLSSPYSPLHTALILLLPISKSPDALDLQLVGDLGVHIPIVVLPVLPKNGEINLDQFDRTPSPVLSSFKPRTLNTLRIGLFRSPETVAQLRAEAADRFMRWREIECAAADICSVRNSSFFPESSLAHRSSSWDKAKWESEWMPTFSVDVAKRLREGTVTQRSVEANKFLTGAAEKGTTQLSLIDSNESKELPVTSSSADQSKTDSKDLAQGERFDTVPKTCSFAETVPPAFGRGAIYDPLHLPSLLIFSISLLGPLKERLDDSFSFLWDALDQAPVRAALMGGFVVGTGVGLVIR